MSEEFYDKKDDWISIGLTGNFFNKILAYLASSMTEKQEEPQIYVSLETLEDEKKTNYESM